MAFYNAKTLLLVSYTYYIPLYQNKQKLEQIRSIETTKDINCEKFYWSDGTKSKNNLDLINKVPI